MMGETPSGESEEAGKDVFETVHSFEELSAEDQAAITAFRRGRQQGERDINRRILGKDDLSPEDRAALERFRKERGVAPSEEA